MTLENGELEQLHTRMNALLAERQGELGRVDDTDKDDDRNSYKALTDEVDDWHAKAQDVPANPSDEKIRVRLENEGREICSRIEALCRT